MNGTILPVFNERGIEDAIEVSIPMNCKDPKDGIYQCHPDGKHAVTVIRYLDEKPLGTNNSPGSVVLCQPKTGRTHQIRLHLQYLGFPIGNDPNYGPVDREGKKMMYTLVKNSTEEHTEFQDAGSRVTSKAKLISSDEKGSQDCVPQENCGDELDSLKSLCSFCKSGAAATFTRVQLHHRGIWLHALKYEGSDWTYIVDGPHWYPAYAP